MQEQSTQEKWDALWQAAESPGRPASVLGRNAHLLPTGGTALDLACGLGANSVLLAEHGLKTHAWDISQVAVDKLQAQAEARGLPIVAEVRDIKAEPLPREAFDVIVVAHFLEHSLDQAIVEALRPGGLLFFETYTQTAVSDKGPDRPEWRLADGELLTMFSPLRPIVYREEGRIGDITRGFRDKALLVAIKEVVRGRP